MKEQKKSLDKIQKKLPSEIIQQEEGDEIDKLVSLTFDEDSKVREEVAKKLGNYLSDPRAILALIDLSSDKNENVKQAAKKALENYVSPDKEAFSSLEKFFEKIHQSEDEQKEWEAQKSLMFPQVEKLFTSKVAKEKLLPSIEKFFSKRTARPQKSLQSDSQPTLTQLEEQQNQQQTIEKSSISLENHSEVEVKSEEESSFPLPQSIKEKLSSPLLSIPKIDSNENLEEQEEEKLPLSFLDIYKFAYTLATNPTIKAADLNKEKKKLINLTKHNINLAFKLAIKKAKEEGGIDSFSNLKAGMKKLSTLPLEVLDFSWAYITKGKKQLKMARIVLSDGRSTLPLYLEEKRATGITKGDLLVLKNCYVDFLIKNPHAQREDEKGELCLFLSDNSTLSIIRTQS
ncbi:MAG: HEAT repeat domain-containing protein [Candidatus Anstonellaceae archaeon]